MGGPYGEKGEEDMKKAWMIAIAAGGAAIAAGSAFGITAGAQASQGKTAEEWAVAYIEERYPVAEYSLTEAKATAEAEKNAFPYDAWIWNGESSWHEHIRIKATPRGKGNAYTLIRLGNVRSRWYEDEVEITSGWGW